MARTEVFTCDICKKSKSAGDLAKIIIKSEGIRIKYVDHNGLKIDICPDCLKGKGFVVEHKNDEELNDAKKQNKATLEDKIYEILEDMGVAFCE